MESYGIGCKINICPSQDIAKLQKKAQQCLTS